MSTKTNATCRAVATRSNKSSVEVNRQPLLTDNAKLPSDDAQNLIATIDTCSTLIEVSVKTKGRKRTSTMVSNSTTSQKAIEEKRKPGSVCGSQQNWSRVLREQNRLAMKQQIASKNLSAKSPRSNTDLKDGKKSTTVQTHQRHEYSRNTKHLDEMPVKQPASLKKADEQNRTTSQRTVPSSTSMASSMEPVYVSDKAAQCGGIFEVSNDRFGVFNPVRTMGFLMKELRDVVKDDKSKKILVDMEDALYRIRLESGRTTPLDLEAISLRAKLEASTVQLEDMSKKMNTMCESLREERDSLQRQVQKQMAMLEEAHVRQTELDTIVKKLRQELDETLKRTELKDKTIYQLKEDSKNVEMSQSLIRSLKSDLSKQSELARQRHMEIQYLILEKDKLSVLSAYKDSLLAELRSAVKELQKQIAHQLSDLKTTYAQDGSSEAQISVPVFGVACSSPNTTSTENSPIPSLWREMLEFSLPPADKNPAKDSIVKKSFGEKSKGTLAMNAGGDSEKTRPTNVGDSKPRDSGQLEFVSLPCGDTSHTNMCPSYKEQPCKESSRSTSKLKDDANGRKSDNLRRSVQSATEISRTESKNPAEKISSKKRTPAKGPSKSRKSLTASMKQSTAKSTLLDDISSVTKDALSNDPIGSDIKEQFQNMFENMRLQSRIPIDIPSPPRYFLNPDWSDSSLPSISAVSDAHVIQSNDT